MSLKCHQISLFFSQEDQKAMQNSVRPSGPDILTRKDSALGLYIRGTGKIQNSHEFVITLTGYGFEPH